MIHSPPLMSSEGPDVLIMAPPDFGNQLAAALNTLYHKLGGGSGGRSPDPKSDKGWIILLAIICWIVVIAIEGWIRSRWPFTMSVISLMLLVCAAPIINVSSQRAVRVVVETSIVIASLALFIWFQFGTQVIGRWILYTSAVVLVLEIGAHIVEWNKEVSIKRLSQWSDLFKFLESDTFVLDKVFRRQQITYSQFR